jgi:Fur family transcriptional regulator, ferric uptake regulator
MAADPDAAPLFERFHRWLRDRHLPVTRQRDRVARVVLTSGDHLSVDDVQRRLADQGESAGTATVYRVLHLLTRSGLVRSHDFGEGFLRYEPVIAEGQHGHLVCTRCGHVTEFSTERFERLLPLVADEHGFQLHRHRVEIHGLCRACREADLGPLTLAAREGRAPGGDRRSGPE